MPEDPQQDKNLSIDDQAVENHVKEMLGPAPQDESPQAAPIAEPPVVAPLPTLPAGRQVPEAVPGQTDDTNKERLLVIPASDQPIVAEAAQVPTNPPVAEPSPIEPVPVEPPEAATPVDPEPVQPLPGDTIAPAEVSDLQVEPEDHKPKEHLRGGKLRRFLHRWWHNRKARNLTLVAAAVVIVGIVLLPTTRYFILNTAGVRSSASLTVLDDSTQLPLKNVEVSLAGQSAKTDSSGNVRLEHLKLGRSKLSIQKRAFAANTTTLTIGWGSNPLGNFKIQPTGSQYTILVKDWLTGQGLAGASASGGEADANADQNGKILITIDTTIAQQDSLTITVHAPNYRDEPVVLDLASKTNQTASMVINHKDVFVSNGSGHYDVYSVDIDGKNKKLVLAGSGLEKDDIVLVQHPTENEAALVSTRVNARNADGFLLSTLTLINLSDNTTQAIAQSEQVQIVGWIGNRLLFVQIAAGASAANSDRFRLMSYDFKTTDKKQLASANAFNDIMLDGVYVYYAPSSAYQKDPNAGLIKSNADGSLKKTLLSNEVWNIFRVSYDSVNLATEKNWYEYTLGSSDSPIQLKEQPANPNNRLYITSLDSKHSLWVDQRDGKGVLIDYDIVNKVDKTLETQDGLAYPVQWLSNDVLIYRIKDDKQTADYVLNINGGTAHKVTDLVNATGIDRWYYY